MSLKHFCIALVSFFLIVRIPAAGLAGEPTEQIKKTTDKVLSILNNPTAKGPASAKEKKELIFRVVDERFDWEEMARRSVARYWQQSTSEEKKEFGRLFRELLGKTYLGKLENYAGGKIVFDGETVDGDYGTVRLRVLTSKNEEIRLENRVWKKGNNWFVYDVLIEGVSMVNNYRTQFNSILLKSSFQDLIARMKAKVTEE